MFIPHGHCYLWKPQLVWLHLLADSAIAIAYYSIPISLLVLVRRRQDLPFTWIFWLFAAFIFACGTTHVLEVWTLWHPDYWLSGAMKAITAIVSGITACQLFPLIPQVVVLPSSKDLEKIIELRTEQLQYLANCDSLTGLYNRRAFDEYLSRIEGKASLLFIDIDGFKLVNDTCGHGSGDRLLLDLAQLLRENVREDDVLARLGGDEFAILLNGCDQEQAIAIAQSIRLEIETNSFMYDGQPFQITVSIGLTQVVDEDALLAADEACKLAKEQGKNQIQTFVGAVSLFKQHWVQRLNRALREDKFCLYCQPILPLFPDRPPHREVLLRLIEGDRVILPGEFLPAAERYGLMPQLDRWVINRVLPKLQEELDTIYAINLSGASINDARFVEWLERSLIGVETQRLCFEVTETVAIANLTRTAAFFTSLQAMGCKIALDDFGSGMSSLNYLRKLPANYLKIDGSFIRNMAVDEADAAVVGAIAKMGQALGLATIAEFVEDAQVLEKLQDFGVDFGQGYYLGRPQKC